MPVVCCQETYAQKAQRGSDVLPMLGGRQVTRSGAVEEPGQDRVMDLKNRLERRSEDNEMRNRKDSSRVKDTEQKSSSEIISCRHCMLL